MKDNNGGSSGFGGKSHWTYHYSDLDNLEVNSRFMANDLNNSELFCAGADGKLSENSLEKKDKRNFRKTVEISDKLGNKSGDLNENFPNQFGSDSKVTYKPQFHQKNLMPKKENCLVVNKSNNQSKSRQFESKKQKTPVNIVKKVSKDEL